MKQMKFDMEIETKIPKRPTVNKDIIRNAARQILERLEFIGIGEDYVEDLVDVYDHFSDGYELAKRLDDRYGWELNIEMVNSLDSMDSIVSGIVRVKEKQWVEEYNIQPELEIGTKIKEGVIHGVSKYHPATYEVLRYGETRKNRYGLIKFEDAEVITDE
jgi:hypothetical protein